MINETTVRHLVKTQIKSKSMDWRLVLILTAVDACCGDSSEELIMENLSTTVGTEVLRCKKTHYFKDAIISELWTYWDTDIPLRDLELGCVLKCVLENLGLLELENKVADRANLAAFFEANGSDVHLTTETIVTLIQICLKATKAQDPCVAALDLALCFRTGIEMMGWTPDIKGPDYIDEVY